MRKKIEPPFFEFGPKAYLYGNEILELALLADELSEKYHVDIIITPQYTDISRIAERTKYVHVFAQHMDAISPGRGIGAVLPEALADVGAEGVLLNHCERRLDLHELETSVRRAKEAGLQTMICADDICQASMIAHLNPDIIIAESPELVGGGRRGPEDAAVINEINRSVWQINPDILVLQGAGITDEKDIYEVIRAGAQAAGSTSGIIKADNSKEMFSKMICSLYEAWNEVHN